MNLYVIKMRRPARPGENDGFVVRSLDEKSARGMLLRHAEEEGAKTWLDTTKSTAILLASDVEGKQEIILSSYWGEL